MNYFQYIVLFVSLAPIFKTKMKYYIIAGEASGDLHSSNLMREIKKLDNNADFRFWGGDLMKAEGGELVKHYKDISFMGFVEVLANIRTISKNINFCKKDILNYNPDIVILVDYPGFNLIISKFLKEKGIKNYYYISPQVWAWHKSRVHKIKKTVDKMFVILPFEKDFYSNYNFNVDFVGHPLLDAVENKKNDLPDFDTFCKENNLNDKPIIALLPGSRKQEIKRMLNVMCSIIEYFPQFQFVIAGTNSVSSDLYFDFDKKYNVKFVFGKTYQLLNISKAALVTSGTATLETALFEVPQVVCYKGSYISYSIAKRLVKINFISLVNLIMNKEVVKELIQNDFNKDNLKSELLKITNNSESIERIKTDYIELKNILGGSGASKNVASKILFYLNNEK